LLVDEISSERRVRQVGTTHIVPETGCGPRTAGKEGGQKKQAKK
jgi:hypothetical protein